MSVVTDHISACARAADGGLWCTTHESMMRGEACAVMLDAEDLAEAARDKERERIVAMVTALADATESEAAKEGAGNPTLRTILLVRAQGMREAIAAITEGGAK